MPITTEQRFWAALHATQALFKYGDKTTRKQWLENLQEQLQEMLYQLNEEKE